MEQKTDIKSLTYDEVSELVEQLGEKRFRGKQLYEWMHVHNVASYDEMTNLPKKFRNDNVYSTKKSGLSDFKRRWYEKVFVCAC